jgi:hypothetical protein
VQCCCNASLHLPEQQAAAHPGSGNTSSWSAAAGAAPACLRCTDSISSCRAAQGGAADLSQATSLLAATQSATRPKGKPSITGQLTSSGGSPLPAPLCCSIASSCAGDARVGLGCAMAPER